MVFHTKPPKWGPSLFRFDNIWLEYKDLVRKNEDLVGGRRASWGGYKFMKLKILKGRVKAWILEVAEATRVEKRSILKRIEKIDRKERVHIGQLI